MVHSRSSVVPLETIRFAAANHLCVELAYGGSRQLIEPYSLRRTRDGNIILHAVKHDTGEDRSYRVDRMEGASTRRAPFVPRYSVEFTRSGPLVVANTVSRPSVSRSSKMSPRPFSMRTIKAGTGPTHLIQCMYCGRRFTKKRNETSLNAHKDKSGYPCPSRTGFLVETKY